jgi:hypothetical protein
VYYVYGSIVYVWGGVGMCVGGVCSVCGVCIVCMYVFV